MRQTLFYIPHEIAGVPVLGVGWLLLAWVLGCACMLGMLWWRQGWNRDTAGYLPVFVLIGAAIAFVLPVLEIRAPNGDVLGLPIRGYGLMLLLGVSSAVGLAAYLARRMGLDPEIIFSAALWLFVGGIVGARGLYVFQKWEKFSQPTWWETVVEVVKFTEGGLVVYGSAIGGLAAGLIFTRYYRLPTLAMADLITPSMAVGLALGRIGCLMNGCCYGGLCEQPWALSFPPESPPHMDQQQVGLLHGFVVAPDADGLPQVQSVRAGTSAAQAGLQPGVRIRSIQLPPVDAFSAVANNPQWVGQTLEIEMDGSRTIPLKIEPAVRDEERALQKLGFDVAVVGDEDLVVRALVPGSIAERSGIVIGDRITAMRLPNLGSTAAAERVLLAAGDQLTVETEAGDVLHLQTAPWPRWSLPVHPTQIYAAVNAALLALLAWSFYPFRRRDGQVFALTLTLYPLTRILEEIVRTDETGIWGTPLTISQMISIGVLLGMAGLWLFIQQRPLGSALPLTSLEASG